MDDLAAMVRQHEDKTEKEINQEPIFVELQEEELKEESQPELFKYDVPIISLKKWFDNNYKQFENIELIKAAIRDIDPEDTLIVKVIDPRLIRNEETGNYKRFLRVLENVNRLPVINLKGKSFDVYPILGFQIIYDFDENISLKGYGVKSGMIVIPCFKNIPYAKFKVRKKNDGGIDIPRPDENRFSDENLSKDVNIEMLKLYYPPIVKHMEGIRTKKDAIGWLLERQKIIYDPRHLLSIDKVIIKYILGLEW